jgi:alpha-glucosidase
MQWDGTANAGFSSVEPWLPLADTFRTNNVSAQRDDETSILQLYRRLIDLRRSRKALLHGNYRPVVAAGDLLVFVREFGEERILAALNLGAERAEASLPSGGRVLLSSGADRNGENVLSEIQLGPHEGLVIELSPSAAPA